MGQQRDRCQTFVEAEIQQMINVAQQSMGERVDSLVEVLRKQAHSKRKTEPDLCLTMHRMVLSKLTKDLIGTEMRLAGKIHGKYC